MRTACTKKIAPEVRERIAAVAAAKGIKPTAAEFSCSTTLVYAVAKEYGVVPYKAPPKPRDEPRAGTRRLEYVTPGSGRVRHSRTSGWRGIKIMVDRGWEAFWKRRGQPPPQAPVTFLVKGAA